MFARCAAAEETPKSALFASHLSAFVDFAQTGGKGDAGDAKGDGKEEEGSLLRPAAHSLVHLVIRASLGEEGEEEEEEEPKLKYQRLGSDVAKVLPPASIACIFREFMISRFLTNCFD